MTIVATPGQREMWHLDRYAGTGSALNVPVAWQLRGELDSARLTEAIAAVLSRHESLRSAFVENGDGVLTVTVTPPPAEPLQIFDVTGQEELAKRLLAFFDEPFDLTSGRPAAAVLLRLGPAEHVLALSAHHIVLDEWSVGIIERDLSVAYRGNLDVAPSYRLADVLGARAAEDTADRRASALAHWTEELAGFESRMCFPGAKPAAGYTAVQIRRSLPPATAARAARVAQSVGATPFGVLLAAFAGVLGRRVNDDDLVIGVPIAGRGAAAAQHAVTYATDLAPLRIRLNGNPTYAALAAQARDRLLSALENGHVPLAEIVRTTGGAAGDDVAGLAEVVVTYRARTGGALDLDGVTASPVLVQAGKSLYPLALHIDHDADGIGLELVSRTLSTEALDDLAERYLRALAAVLTDPDMPLADWPTVLPVDRVPGLTGPALPSETVVDAFLDAAHRWPDMPAVIDRYRTVSYAELRDAASAVATAVVDAGVRPGDTVAVAVRRGAGMLSAMLGVMQSAGVYLPVAPDWPEHRLRMVLADASVTCVVSDTPQLPVGGLPIIDPLPVACPTPADPRATPEDPAYLIYTSGSTGKPKGVLVDHCALSRLIDAMRATFAPAPGRRMLATTTTTFDISLVELLLPLTGGATCVIADEEAVRDPALLGALVAAERVEFAQGTPTWWSLMVEHLPATIADVVVAGEPLSAELRDRLLRVAGRAFNGYGPTETTIYATMWQLAPEVPVSIGSPIDGTVAWVLDRWDRPCATGAVGRLFIGGAGVGIGYLNRPDLTADRFRDGIAGLTEQRLYDTGDLAAWGDDGLLYLYGRNDTQIKLRGYRIELGEIESVLAAVAGVTAAVVVPFTRGEDQRGLAAFVTGDATEQDIRAALSARLPEYMRPAVVRRLAELPVTGSGKTDRKQLAQLVGFAEPAIDRPLTPAQIRVGGLFRAILGTERIGASDRFFDLGGDSIGAARLLVRLRREFGVPLSLKEFVADPTVAGVTRKVNP
ncbi:amino acid adenylation domain-containing protein [Micromonospora lupini]|uniref:non-ribosomal peptide synthetase n=1 Tax=Micromonospora lupini TaxID=285679 RepID=UPI0033CE0F80